MHRCISIDLRTNNLKTINHAKCKIHIKYTQETNSQRDFNTIERKNSTEYQHQYAELGILCVMCIVVERRNERMNLVETSNEVGKATSLGRQRS